MDNKENIEKLVKLKNAKDKLINTLKGDVKDPTVLEHAKLAYNEYASIYKSITASNPEKSFEELVATSLRVDEDKEIYK